MNKAKSLHLTWDEMVRGWNFNEIKLLRDEIMMGFKVQGIEIVWVEIVVTIESYSFKIHSATTGHLMFLFSGMCRILNLFQPETEIKFFENPAGE